MNKLKAKHLLAVVALLGSSVASAITVNVTPSPSSSLVSPIGPSGTFSVTISSPDMNPAVVGATLGLQYDAARVAIDTVTPLVPIAPFNDSTYLANAGPSNCAGGLACDGFVVIKTTAGGVVGPLSLVQINFIVLNNALNQNSVGNASVIILEDGADFTWTDASTGGPIQNVNYNQAQVFVGTAAVPIPAAAWLFVSAFGTLVGFKRVRQS